MDEDFEEWKAWFDSHKDTDGTINLSKHPDLLAYLKDLTSVPEKIDLDKIPNLGSVVDFKLGDERTNGRRQTNTDIKITSPICKKLSDHS